MKVDLSTVLLALPVFFLLYTCAGMLLGSRRRSLPFMSRHPQASSGKSLTEFSSQVGQLGINQTLLNIPGFRQRLDLLLLRSGFPYGWKTENLLVYKEATLLFVALFLWQLDVHDPITWVFSLTASFWLLDIYLILRKNARKSEMQKQLPGLVDLLALALESGLDLMIAIERIFEKMKSGALREELQTLLQESRLGSPRKEILQRWAFRTDLTDIQSLSSLITQSEEMGTPLANVLRSYTEDMRNRRILRAEELAGKIPVKILFPMMVFFFPIVFVIILGPIALQFMNEYK